MRPHAPVSDTPQVRSIITDDAFASADEFLFEEAQGRAVEFLDRSVLPELARLMHKETPRD